MFAYSIVKQIAIITILSATAALPNLYIKSKYKPKIAGGDPIDIKHVPFQVYLRHSDGFDCGGTLISENWVLSAAHCGRPDCITIGSSNLVNATEVDIVEYYSHPLFNLSVIWDYDFSLIKLADYYSDGLIIDFATLPEDNEEIPDNSMLRVSGWGLTLSKGDDENILRSVMVPKVSKNKCKSTYGEDYITDSMFCAGYDDGGFDSCEGDSGGPILLRDKVVGVVSWGGECGKPDSYGVYAKVPHVRAWIREITGL